MITTSESSSRIEERITNEKESKTTVVLAVSGDCEFLRRSFFDKGKFLGDGG